MKTVKFIIRAKHAESEERLRIAKEVYAFEVNQLQSMLDTYAHTGIEHYWEDAKEQSVLCKKLYLLTLK